MTRPLPSIVQMSSDSKGSRILPSDSLVVEAVAGAGASGAKDGALSRALFNSPFGLCQFGDSLIVADHDSGTIRQVTGLLGVADPLAESIDGDATGLSPAEYESRAVPLLMAAVPGLLRELARVTVQYARPGGRVTTIAGIAHEIGSTDGRALGQALFHRPTCVAVDESDAVAGPRLLIGEYTGRVIRCLTLRTGLVSTIAGAVTGDDPVHADGPVSTAQFASVYGLAVAPNGALFVSDHLGCTVRHVSAAVAAAPNGKALTADVPAGAAADRKAVDANVTAVAVTADSKAAGAVGGRTKAMAMG